jgi:hypothetical protein
MEFDATRVKEPTFCPGDNGEISLLRPIQTLVEVTEKLETVPCKSRSKRKHDEASSGDEQQDDEPKKFKPVVNIVAKECLPENFIGEFQPDGKAINVNTMVYMKLPSLRFNGKAAAKQWKLLIDPPLIVFEQLAREFKSNLNQNPVLNSSSDSEASDAFEDEETDLVTLDNNEE